MKYYSRRELYAMGEPLGDSVTQRKVGGGYVCGGGGKGGGGSSPAPDPNIGLAQQKMADLSQKEFEQWQTDIWPTLKSQTEKQNTRADEQFALDKEAQGIQMDSAKKNLAEYDRNAVNRESIYKEAEDYGTEENQQRMAEGAIGDVTTAATNADIQKTQQMQSYGINPNSGQFQGMKNSNQVVQAANAASAATQARNAAIQLGWAKKMDAAGLAQGSFGNQATSTGLALSSGGQALNSGQTTISNAGAMGNSMAQGYGGAMSGWNNVGQLGVQKYNADIQKYSVDQQAASASSAGWGALAGSVIGAGAKIGVAAMSDIRTKENIEVVGYLPNGLLVYEYEYKPEFKDHKHAGHGRYRGLMAHEVEKVIPEAVFEMDNGYKAINYSKVN